MSNTLYDKSVLDKLFAFGESTFDRLSEAGGLNAEALKKFGAVQAELAEAAVNLGGKQVELLGKTHEPAELVRSSGEALEAWRTQLQAWFTGVRGIGEELYNGY